MLLEGEEGRMAVKDQSAGIQGNVDIRAPQVDMQASGGSTGIKGDVTLDGTQK